MRQMVLKILLSFSITLLFGCSKRTSEEHRDILIHNINIVNPDGTINEEMEVYIQNDTIAEIFSIRNLFHYSADNFIDGKGMYLLSDLWDNHTHFRGGKNRINASPAQATL